MEQADSKHCPKSAAGEEHERHSWLDKDGLHSCDGDILSANEVFSMLGMHRVADGDVPMYDDFPVTYILPTAPGILMGEPKNSLKDVTAVHKELFPKDFGPVEEMTGPSYSPNDPMFQVADLQKYLAFQMDIPLDSLMGPKTEFAHRTYGWSEEQLREALYNREQEVIELKMLLTKFGEKVEKAISKMFGKVDKINAR